LGEVVIDRLDPAFRVKNDDQHLAFEAVPHLLEAREFFAKSDELLLQAFVEHGGHTAGQKGLAALGLTIGAERLF
jgi:hypothetical protein